MLFSLGYIWKDQEDGIQALLRDDDLPLDKLLIETDAPFMFPFVDKVCTSCKWSFGWSLYYTVVRCAPFMLWSTRSSLCIFNQPCVPVVGQVWWRHQRGTDRGCQRVCPWLLSRKKWASNHAASVRTCCCFHEQIPWRSCASDHHKCTQVSKLILFRSRFIFSTDMKIEW